MAKKGRKQKERLEKRIASWEKIKDQQSPGGHKMHKPGSNKKS